MIAKKKAEKDASDQLRDVERLLTDMSEARAKFVKLCDKDSIKEVKKVMNARQSSAIGTATQILDRIC